MSAPGETFSIQLNEAAVKAAMDARFGRKLSRDDLQYVSIEIWIQTGAREITSDDIENNVIQLGVDGIEVSAPGHFAYYKPSVAITKTYTSSEKLFSALCRKARLESSSWKDSTVVKHRTDWICLISAARDSGGIEPLKSLRTTTQDRLPSLDEVRTWVSDSCRYLSNHQHASGDVSYIYDPVEDKISDEALNIVRAAGCLYSLSVALEGPNSSVCTPKAAIALAGYLVDQTTLFDGRHRVLANRLTRSAPKLGATALLTLALHHDAFHPKFGSVRDELLSSILNCQETDGRFITEFGVAGVDPKLAIFYSGQALLALTAFAEDGHAVALEACKRAFESYKSDFTLAPTTAFVGWHVDVWSRLAILCENSAYADFAFAQIDWLSQFQILDATQGVFNGGFSKDGKPPGFSSIVFLEAQMTALRLAVMLGDSCQIKKLVPAVRAGIIFCGRLRIDRIPRTFFPRPSRGLGGISLSLTDLRIRCDVVQHFITMSLKIIKVADLIL